jgi:hypothetical protein
MQKRYYHADEFDPATSELDTGSLATTASNVAQLGRYAYPIWSCFELLIEMHPNFFEW